MLSSHPPCPTFDPSRAMGEMISLNLYANSKDWSVKHEPLTVIITAADFDVEFLYLHKETGADPDSGVWILLPDFTVIFYCNFWQYAGFGGPGAYSGKRTVSVRNRIEGNYYLRSPDLNDIESYYKIPHKLEVMKHVF